MNICFIGGKQKGWKEINGELSKVMISYDLTYYLDYIKLGDDGDEVEIPIYYYADMTREEVIKSLLENYVAGLY